MFSLSALLSKFRSKQEVPEEGIESETHPVLQDIETVRRERVRKEEYKRAVHKARIASTNQFLEVLAEQFQGLKFQLSFQDNYVDAELKLLEVQEGEFSLQEARAGQKYLAFVGSADGKSSPALILIYKCFSQFYGLYWYRELDPYTHNYQLLELASSEEVYRLIISKIDIGLIRVETEEKQDPQEEPSAVRAD